MSASALQLHRVTVRYEPGAQPVLRGVSLAVAPGERVALLGLNGSGKTTLLMAAAGLVRSEGEIRVCGAPLTRRTLRQIRLDLGFLFSVPGDQLLLPRVIDDVAFGLRQRGATSGEALTGAAALLAALGAGHLAQQPVHHLSHGQQKRVALAGALVASPPLLLLDEPSAGLDPPGKRELSEHLRRLPAAMLVATHDLAFAARLCSRYILLDGGEVAAEGEDLSEVARGWGEPELR